MTPNSSIHAMLSSKDVDAGRSLISVMRFSRSSVCVYVSLSGHGIGVSLRCLLFVPSVIMVLYMYRTIDCEQSFVIGHYIYKLLNDVHPSILRISFTGPKKRDGAKRMPAHLSSFRWRAGHSIGHWAAHFGRSLLMSRSIPCRWTLQDAASHMLCVLSFGKITKKKKSIEFLIFSFFTIWINSINFDRKSLM